MRIPECQAHDCHLLGEWQVLPVTDGQGNHTGTRYAPYRINHIRQAAHCLDHAKTLAHAKNLKESNR